MGLGLGIGIGLGLGLGLGLANPNPNPNQYIFVPATELSLPEPRRSVLRGSRQRAHHDARWLARPMRPPAALAGRPLAQGRALGPRGEALAALGAEERRPHGARFWCPHPRLPCHVAAFGPSGSAAAMGAATSAACRAMAYSATSSGAGCRTRPSRPNA